MHQLSNLCYMLEDEIGRITQKGDISPAELENVYKAVKTMYYVKVIEAMEESKRENYDGYSGRRMMISYDRGPYYNNASYEGRSYDHPGDSKEEMRRHIEMAMDQAKTEPERRALMECLNKL